MQDHNFRTSKFEMTLMKWATQQLYMQLYVEVLQILVGELTIFVPDMNNLRTSDQRKCKSFPNKQQWSSVDIFDIRITFQNIIAHTDTNSKEMKISDTNEKIQKK